MFKILYLCQSLNSLSMFKSLIDKGYHVDIITNTQLPEYYLMKEQMTWVNNLYVVENYEDFLRILELLLDRNKYDYIFPTFSDSRSRIIAEINEEFNLPGLRPPVREKIKEKLNYYQIWEDLNFKVPKIYQTVPHAASLEIFSRDIKFPCLVKPSAGHSGLGIKIISNGHELLEFFKDVDHQSHKYQVKNGEKFKGFEYFSDGKEYIIQEYIEGPVISIIGHVYNGKIQFDLIYDIESNSYPYTAETSLIYPSKHYNKFLFDRLFNDMQEFISKIDLDNCPFMLDVILRDNELYLIDFAARISAGSHLIHFAGDPNYAPKLVERLLLGKDLVLDLKNCCMKKGLPLKNGTIKTLKINKDHLADFIKYPSSDRIFLLRNDPAIINNGYVYMTGNSLEELDQKYQELIDSIEVDYL